MIYSSEILSPTMLWKDFDTSLPLKESITNEIFYDDVTYCDVHFSGREVSPGQRVRIYASMAVPKKAIKGCILIIPDTDSTGITELINHFARLDYAVLAVDYAGEKENSSNYTIYPQEIEYANFNKSGEYFYKAEYGANKTSWFEWTAVCRYAISFLKTQNFGKIGVLGIKNGSNVAWQVVATDERVDCLVGLFGAGWIANKGVFKNGVNNIEMNDERYRFIAGVEAQSYAPLVKCPILFLTSSNSSDFDLDRQMDTLSRIPSKNVYLNISPKLDEYLNNQSLKDIELFYNKFLSNADFKFFNIPEVSLTLTKNAFKIFVEVDSKSIKNVESYLLYVSEDIVNPAHRNWTEVKNVQPIEDGYAENYYELKGGSDYVDVFAVITYKNGLTLSSLVCSKKLAKTEQKHSNLIFSGKTKTGSFVSYKTEKGLIGNVFYPYNVSPEIVEGPYGIRGILCTESILCYNIGEKSFNKSEGTIIKFDFYSKEFCKLTIELFAENNPFEVYSLSLDLSVGATWKNLVLKLSDFKSDCQMPIKSYEGIYALNFKSESTFIINNVLLID